MPLKAPEQANAQTPLVKAALKAHQQDNLPLAVNLYYQALQENASVEAYANLGVALRMQGHMEAAVVAYRQALALEPDHVPALSNLGGAYRALGQLDAALPILKQAIALDPVFAAAHYNLGLAYMDSGQAELAVACFETTLQLEPERLDAHFDRAVCILQQGDLERGFAAYECRFSYAPRLIKPYTQPQWDGLPLNGQTLLLHAEQGFGDTLQFSRYIPLIKKGPQDRIILECPLILKRLMEQVPGIDQVVVPGDPLPAFDQHASLLSLPYLFRTTLDSIPAAVPYLKAPFYRLGLQAKSRALKVGIVWASGHTDIGIRNRSLPLAKFLPLLELPGVQFYSLQKGPQVQELKTLGLQGLIQNMDAQIQDFADTAAILEELDLLISVDTAIVHLAGALNKPVWVLLPSGSEWRWLRNRKDSLWYPSVRLFRQSELKAWDESIAQVAQSLQQLTGL